MEALYREGVLDRGISWLAPSPVDGQLKNGARTAGHTCAVTVAFAVVNDDVGQFERRV